MAEESESDTGGMTAGEVSESYGNFGGSLAESLGAVAESLGSGTGGYDMGGYGGSGSSLADALGQTEAGRFGVQGVEGTLAEAPGTTDVAAGLSAIGLGDINMGGFNLGGISGTGVSPDGVVGEGFGAGNMAVGTSFTESLADVIGGNFPGGFNLSGVSSVSPSSTPFGGYGPGVMPGTQLGPSQLGQTGPGFGFTSRANVYAGAPYQGAEVEFLGASGVPGTRANAFAEQQALMAEQAQRNPTFEISSTMPMQDVALSLRGGLLANLPGIPGVPAELNASTLAAAAATPVTSFAQPVEAAPAPQTTAQAAPTPQATPAPSPTQPAQAPVQSQSPAPVSRDVSPAVVAPNVAGSPPSRPAASPVAGPRSISGVEVETFADPLTGAPVTVTTENGVQNIMGGAAPKSGIAGLMDSPMFSTAVNTGLSLASPYLGLANLGLLATTGTGLYGQARSLATGQGFQTGGGLMGLVGQPGGVPGTPTDIAYSGGESYYGGPVAPQVVAPPTEVINPQAVQRAPVVPANPYGFNIADFVTAYDPRNYSDYLPAPSYRA